MKKNLLLVGLLCLFALAACGKFASPEPYPDSGYPHTYPQR